jgi:hypothetical protein
MKINNLISEVELLLESPNLDFNDTGISKGKLYFDDFKQHYARVKYSITGNTRGSDTVVIQLDPIIEPYIKFGKFTDSKTKKEVLEFITKNNKLLLSYYNGAISWTDLKSELIKV